MDVAIRQKSASSLLREAKFFKLLCLFLAISVLVLAVAITARTMQTERIVVVPPVVNSKFWLEPHQVSRSYFVEWGHYIAMLLLNVSPESVDYQSEMILRYVSSKYRDEMRTELTDAALHLRQEGLSTNFAVTDVYVDKENSTVAFSGVLASYVEKREITRKSAAFMLVFEVKDGQLNLKQFSETDPKNVFIELSK